jgi:predicted transcriptional regulator of viral defense system
MKRRQILLGSLALAAFAATLGRAGTGRARAASPEVFPDDRMLGSAEAPLTIIEYSSLTCPHCAAHQRPQEFQVCLERARRPLACSRVRVAFIVRKRLRDVPVQSVNTPRGTLLISTPEATALDLVGYPHRAGGLNQVATVLGELAERLDADKLVAVADTAPPAWSQRLGYVLERVDAAEKAAPLKEWVQAHAHKSAVLLAGAKSGSGARDKGWKIVVNVSVEPDL